MKLTFLLIATLLFLGSASADPNDFFKKEFQNRDGCFVLVDVTSGKVLYEYNSKRCKKRFPPMSTFKIPLAMMAYDSRYFKTVDQSIQWDGKIRGRKTLNQDQTPKSFIDNSVIWVSRLIVNFLGKEKVQDYVRRYGYGNQLVSGNLNSFWLSEGSIKVSAIEQTQFLSRFWLKQLPLDQQARKLTSETIFSKKINQVMIYGKTGTGCIDKGCENKPGRQLGWYVGLAKEKDRVYSFALNFSDNQPVRGYGGPKARKIVQRFFEKALHKFFEPN